MTFSKYLTETLEHIDSDGQAPATDAGRTVASTRFQFGILRILTLTAAIAVVIAIPVQILARLKKISLLGAYLTAFEVMMVAVVLAQELNQT